MHMYQILIVVVCATQHMVDTLFSNDDMFTFLNEQEDRIRQEIQAGGMDGPIRKDPENAIELLRDKYVLKPVRIDWEKKDSKRTIQDDVMKVSFHITFTGDPHLLQYRPSTYRMESVPGTVYGQDQIAREITGLIGREYFKRELERWQESMEFHLNNANSDADNFNRVLPAKIKSMIDARTEQIHSADDEMDDMGFS